MKSSTALREIVAGITAGYLALCLFFLLLIGVLSRGTTNPGVWLMELSVSVIASCLMLLCLYDFKIPHIPTSILMVINALIIVAVFITRPADGYDSTLGTTLKAIVPWSALFWSIYYFARRLPWHQRIYLSAFFTIPATRLWYLIPPYLDGLQPDFMLWWRQPMFGSMAGCIYFSIELYTVAFLILMLWRTKWKLTAGSIMALWLFTSYSLVRLFLPQLFTGPPLTATYQITLSYFTRLPLMAFFMALAYFGFRSDCK